MIRSTFYKLLRQAEQYTRTDMVYLAKGSFWLFLGQAIGLVLGILVSVAFANLLPQDIYGKYKYILSIAEILGGLSFSGLAIAIVRSVSRGYDGALQEGIKKYLSSSIAMSVGALGFALYYLLNHQYEIAICFFFVAILQPAFNAYALYASYLNGKKDFKRVATYNFWGNLFPAASLVIALFLTDKLWVLALIYFASNATIMYILYRATIIRFKPAATTESETIAYGKHLSLINLITLTATHIDKVLIFHFLGPIDLAIYAFATTLPINIKGALKHVGSLAMPKFAKRPMQEIRKELRSKMLILFLFLVVVTLIYILIAPIVFRLLFPAYTDSVVYSQVFALSLIAFVGVLPHAALQAKGAVKELYQVNIVGSILKIVLLFFGVQMYGLWGAVIIFVLAKFIDFGILMYLFAKKTHFTQIQE